MVTFFFPVNKLGFLLPVEIRMFWSVDFCSVAVNFCVPFLTTKAVNFEFLRNLIVMEGNKTG